MTVFVVRHVTKYQYKRPVRLGEHRLMFRPRDSFDQRLLHSELTISPKPARVSLDGFTTYLATASRSSILIHRALISMSKASFDLNMRKKRPRTSKLKNTPSFTRLDTQPNNCLTCLRLFGASAWIQTTISKNGLVDF
jgi:Bacterial transglutaminase-like N-terminal region